MMNAQWRDAIVDPPDPTVLVLVYQPPHGKQPEAWAVGRLLPHDPEYHDPVPTWWHPLPGRPQEEEKPGPTKGGV